jgi:7-cyano-7-deazaguanine tRNA-ribosyltransferase
MMFALAVAMGCDLFDSAAYAIYARDDRYLTVRGTRQLDDVDYFPCTCPVCTARTSDDLRAEPDDERERLLAEHNLHVSLGELRRIKDAIRTGNLLELVETRARAHPTMLDGYRALLDHAAQLERQDPASKGSFFYCSAESARRPEVLRHHDRLGRLDVPETLLLTEGAAPSGDRFDAAWRLVPPFGPVPRALSDTYPFTAELPDRVDAAACEAAARGVARLLDAAPETNLTVAHDDWPASALASLPDSVTVEPLGARPDRSGD